MDFTLSSYIYLTSRIDHTKYCRYSIGGSQDFALLSRYESDSKDFNFNIKTRLLSWDMFVVRGSFETSVDRLDFNFISSVKLDSLFDHSIKSKVKTPYYSDFRVHGNINKKKFKDFIQISFSLKRDYMDISTKSYVVKKDYILSDFSFASSIYIHPLLKKVVHQIVLPFNIEFVKTNNDIKISTVDTKPVYASLPIIHIIAGANSLFQKAQKIHIRGFEKILPIHWIIRKYRAVEINETTNVYSYLCKGKKVFLTVGSVYLDIATGRIENSNKKAIYKTDYFSLTIRNNNEKNLKKVIIVRPLKKQPFYIANSFFSRIIYSNQKGKIFYKIAGMSTFAGYSSELLFVKLKPLTFLYKLEETSFLMNGFIQKINKSSFLSLPRSVFISRSHEVVVAKRAIGNKITIPLSTIKTKTKLDIETITIKNSFCFKKTTIYENNYYINGISYKKDREKATIETALSVKKEENSIFCYFDNNEINNATEDRNMESLLVSSYAIQFIKVVPFDTISYTRTEFLTASFQSAFNNIVNSIYCEISRGRLLDVKSLYSQMFKTNKREYVSSLVCDLTTGHFAVEIHMYRSPMITAEVLR